MALGAGLSAFGSTVYKSSRALFSLVPLPYGLWATSLPEEAYAGGVLFAHRVALAAALYGTRGAFCGWLRWMECCSAGRPPPGDEFGAAIGWLKGGPIDFQQY